MAVKLSEDKAEELYNEITLRVHEMVETALDRLEQQPYYGEHNMVDLISPMLERATQAADVVGEHFLEYYKKGSLPAEKRLEIEMMLRAVFTEVFAYHERLDNEIPKPKK